MTIVVEDGTGVDGANSYITRDEVLRHAKDRGLPITGFEADTDAHIIRAADLIEAKADRFVGVKTAAANAMEWPRERAVVNGITLETDAIPPQLKKAQIEFVMALDAGIDIAPTATGDAFVVSEKVGPLETKYSETQKTSGVPIVRAAERWLSPLLNGGGAGLTTRRA